MKWMEGPVLSVSFLSHPCQPMTHGQKGHGDRNEGYALLSNMDFHSPRSTYLRLLLSAQSSTGRH